MLDVVQNNILNFWLKMEDNENGGFYGQMTGDGMLVPTANKGGILNARILWSFSAAYRVLKKPEYLEAATRAKDYIVEHFVDNVYGGTYWELDYKGNPVDTKKQFYAIGFMIYGLSEYARATGDKQSLDLAIELYKVIEEHSLDEVYNANGARLPTCDSRNSMPTILSRRTRICTSSSRMPTFIASGRTSVLKNRSATSLTSLPTRF